MLDESKLINYEVMGDWPIYKMTLEEILRDLGASVKDGRIGFDLDSPVLKLFPRRLKFDAMGYGVDEEWVHEANTDGETFINLGTIEKLPDKNLHSYIVMMRENEKEIEEWYKKRQNGN